MGFARSFMLAVPAICSPVIVQAATMLDFTVTMSEAVNVNTASGTPRIAIDVGGTARFANYTSGSGTANLTFTYAAVPGDVDLDGVSISSPVLLNGGTIKDLAGNDAVLTFTPPNTSNIKINYPSLGLDFSVAPTGRYTVNGTVYNSWASFVAGVGASFSRASIGTYFDSTGTLNQAAAGVPRFDFDPTTLSAKGLMIEESRTNYTPNSQFTGLSGGTYTAQQSLPGWLVGFGTFTSKSVTLTPGTAGGIPYMDVRVQASNGIASTQYVTFNPPVLTGSMSVVNGTKTISSAWFGVSSYSASGGTCGVFLSNRSMTSGQGYVTSNDISFTSVVPYQRRSTGVLTHGATAAYGALWTFVSVPSGVTCDITYRVGGPQFEEGSFVTSYIPTTGTAVTRAAEDFTIPTTGWFNTSQSTLYGYGSTNGVNSASTLADINDGGWNNRFQIRWAGGPLYSGIITSSAVVQTVFGTSAYTLNTDRKTVLSAQLNDAAQYGNGISIGTDSSVTMPVGQNVMRVGAVSYGTEYLNGRILGINYYPVRLPNTQLQLLSQ